MTIDSGRRRTLLALGMYAISPVVSGKTNADLPPLTGVTMGTRYRLLLASRPDNVSLLRIKHQVEGILEATEAAMSLYRPESELSTFNQRESYSPMQISPGTRRVVSAGLAIKEASDQAFDPCAGRLVEQWGFGSGNLNRADRLVSPAESQTGFGSVVVQDDHIYKTERHVALNLNGIAKGDAIDQIGNMLDGYAIRNFLIEIGGEILTRGVGPGGRPWRIGIEHPRGGVKNTVHLSDKAVATSGDYTEFYLVDGKRICHLVDPRSGKPISHNLSAVSVIADSAIAADAWATALTVLGPDEGPALAERNNLIARFIVRNGSGFQARHTSGFKHFLN